MCMFLDKIHEYILNRIHYFNQKKCLVGTQVGKCYELCTQLNDQIIKRNTIKHSAISIYILRLYRHRLNTLTCIIPELDEGDTCPACPKVIDV